ncbi:MAG: hypothetical protein ACON42_04295 [Flavobacteriaceae bacterium]
MNRINFEHWPWYILYIPAAFYWAWLAILEGSATYFTRVNPAMINSGAVKSSKWHYLQKLPASWIPKTQLHHSEGLQLPIVVKPDDKERGRGVRVLSEHHREENALFQEFCDLPYECGIFYYRLGNSYGITSITEKKILPHQPIGSHNLGTTFLDGRKRITPALTEAIHTLASALLGFNYGRLDIKFNSWEELEQLQHFKILEINGVNSEPTHIYQPGYSLGQAYKDIFAHMKLMQQIARQNRHLETRPVFSFLNDWICA